MKKKLVSFESTTTIFLIFIAFVVTLIQEFFIPGFASNFATHNKWDAGIILHVFGHSGWSHFIGNTIYIAMLGPSVEDRFGTIPLALMTLITALVIGAVSIVTQTPCYGLSTVAYMWVILNTFYSDEQEGIPVTSLILLLVFVLPEAISIFTKHGDHIAHQNHVLGAACGFGFGIATKIICSTEKK